MDRQEFINRLRTDERAPSLVKPCLSPGLRRVRQALAVACVVIPAFAAAETPAPLASDANGEVAAEPASLGAKLDVKISDMVATPTDGLKAGVGIVDITPTEPVKLAGPPTNAETSAIDTRLYVKALVLSAGGQKVAIVTLDAFKYQVLQAEKARRAIAAATGIPVNDITISASDTHRGPLWTYYKDELATPITEAVASAVRDLAPVTVAAAKGKLDGVSEDRRVIKDGTAWNRWQLPPSQQDKYPAEGPIDTSFDVLAVVGGDGRYKAIVYDFACHASNTRDFVISADYPGDVQQYVQEKLGYDAPTLFLNGPSGDVNPVSNDLAYPKKPKTFFGASLGAAILAVLARQEPIANPVVKLESLELQMPGREIRAFAETDIRRKWPGEFKHYQDAFEAQMRTERPSYRFFMTGVSIGDSFAIVTSPDELFSELGLAIERQSPFKYTMVVGQTNGGYGYIPTAKALRRGGYETWFGLQDYLSTQAGQIVETYSLKILNDLKSMKEATP